MYKENVVFNFYQKLNIIKNVLFLPDLSLIKKIEMLF